MRLSFLLCLFVYASYLLGQESGDKSILVDQLINEFLRETKVPGISITVNKDEEIIYSKGFGYADVKNKVEMKATTQNRTASVSKMLTVTALARLVTIGKLDLDLPIKHYIPYLKDPFSQLTTRQLASHTAGVRHQPVNRKSKKKNYSSTKDCIHLVEETSLMFEQGTKYQYSTLAYNLLAGVIEGASGKTYVNYMQEDIFSPLEMNQTFPEEIAKLSSSDAKMYFFRNGRITLDKKPFNGSYKLAGAGFRSTSVDLAKLMNAYTNEFIAQDVIEDMFSNIILKNGEKLMIGVGWRLNNDIQNRLTVEHAGSWQGTRTVIVHYPREKLSISIMINAQCIIFIEETAHLIAQVFLNHKEVQYLLPTFDQAIEIIYNETDSSTQSLSGKLSLNEDGVGFLQVDTELKFLQHNKIIPLGIKNMYVLSTEFGLLYLDLKLNPELEGELYIYQAMDRNKRAIFSLKAI